MTAKAFIGSDECRRKRRGRGARRAFFAAVVVVRPNPAATYGRGRVREFERVRIPPHEEGVAFFRTLAALPPADGPEER